MIERSSLVVSLPQFESQMQATESEDSIAIVEGDTSA